MAPKSKLLRMDNVLIVVDDLEAAKAFFAELGMELEGEAPVEGRWVDRVVGLNDVRADIAMMRTPDGHGRIELTKFHTPPAVRAEPESAPANTLGIRRIMFAVDDIDDVVARVRSPRGSLPRRSPVRRCEWCSFLLALRVLSPARMPRRSNGGEFVSTSSTWPPPPRLLNPATRRPPPVMQ